MNQTTRLWGGRFRKPPDPRMMRLSSAAGAYSRLAPQDIAGGKAHAAELERAGLLSPDEMKLIVATLDGIAGEFAAGTLLPGPEDEDIHTFIERVLVARIGATGAKLRAGRSRNDQAANNLKLYLREQSRLIGAMLAELLAALAGQAEQHAASVCPGFTHLQSAQPVTFGHWLMAHGQALSRDATRLQDWDRRSTQSPLGAAALAGSAIALSPELSAKALGYDGPCENSVDAVGARDHVAEFLFVAAMLATNLSRLAEEVTLWTSRQFGWVVLDDAFATGSSIMPQKKNPDIAELSRGRAARLTGDLVAMLGALKGLPLAYNRDLAEDKRSAFDAVDVLGEVLPAFAGMIETMAARPEVMRAQAGAGFALATEVADYLARKGVPFAEAHEISGSLVRYCEEMGRELEHLDAVELSAIDPRLTEDVRACLTLDAAVAARSGFGGTAPARVAEQIARFRTWLAAFEDWTRGAQR
ncbi:MAG TPA: argininosuccinate lyase [Bosea sp. (in: a-proteobacteria)]|jgi:argininosuccinate lyase|uniref:argininosuccinate lyase n=1 Tax=Bosea sp. (in: a-proteobacteria) TaxID=1871050 RepID=UPI002E12619C|nr:argininosuccinate lyase [Bosea sp. (in: a-proteobacteria)]